MILREFNGTESANNLLERAIATLDKVMPGLKREPLPLYFQERSIRKTKLGKTTKALGDGGGCNILPLKTISSIGC